jgi:hypothetical protein
MERGLRVKDAASRDVPTKFGKEEFVSRMAHAVEGFVNKAQKGGM